MELVLLPVLILLGLGFGFIGDDEGAQTADQSGTAGEGDEGMEPQQPVTPQNNILNFSDEGDIALGSENDDVIRGLGGDDVILAGAGNDNIFAGDGDDTVAGETGDDRIFLGAGDDTSTNGDVFTDLAVSPSGQPAGGDDLIRGGAGDDRIIDILGSNTLYGDTGNDILSGRDAEFDQNTGDTLFGGFGSDVLRANDGDTLTGGAGIDTFDVEARGTADAAIITDFEDGERLIIREPGESGPVAMERISTAIDPNGEDLNILLDDAVVTILKGVTTLPDDAFAMMSSGTGGASGSGETPEEPETPVGNEEPVLPETPLPPAPAEPETPVDPAVPPAVVEGTGADEVLVLEPNQVSVNGRGGEDVISRFDITPELLSGEENLPASADDAPLSVRAGSGDDVVFGSGGNDLLKGEADDDLLVGNEGTDRIEGGAGDDRLNARDLLENTPDLLSGGDGDDVISGDTQDVLIGGEGRDLFNNFWDTESNGPVIVKDFDRTEDRLQLVHQSDVTIDSRGFTAVFSDDGNDTLIRYNGSDIFVLEGIDNTDDWPFIIFSAESIIDV